MKTNTQITDYLGALAVAIVAGLFVAYITGQWDPWPGSQPASSKSDTQTIKLFFSNSTDPNILYNLIKGYITHIDNVW